MSESAGAPGFWWRSLGGAPAPRAPLESPSEADVAIVGAGYTGLWTAYYLKRAAPSLEIAILEREFAGFGASGRNGGWVTGFFSGSPAAYEAGRPGEPARCGSGRGAGYEALQQAMFETVDEVGRVLSEHAIDADFVKAGQLHVALNEAQEARLRELVRRRRAEGLGEADLRVLEAAELARRVRVASARCATFSPHVARVHPAKLLVGLARTVEALGVKIYERTPVSELRRGAARTPAGALRARWVIRATEGYTNGLHGLARELVPLNSSMIVTEPLAEEAWQEIGWSGSELLSDEAHVYCYLQRTADGRIAIGGRGVPYRFASRTASAAATPRATVEHLRAALAAMFPAAAGAAVDDAWSGVLGVPRDWCMSVGLDRDSGLGGAGGYAGQGVASANLAGRTLRDLVLGERSELTSLPWVGHRSRRWEPEPLRFCAIRGVYALYRAADRRERSRARTSRLARVADAVSGRS